MGAQDHEYAAQLGIASLLLAIDLTDRERDHDRADRKQNVVAKKWGMLREAFPRELSPLDVSDPEPPNFDKASAALGRLSEGWERDQERMLLVDLSMGDPFAPYELKYRDEDLRESLRMVAVSLGLSGRDASDVMDARREAIRAHRSLNWKKIAVHGAVGTLIVAAGGWALAPVLAGALGTAAGLSGAAATAHGLALLGGGTLAAGGLGMAGGAWVVAGGGALVGVASGGGAQALLQLGASQARVELIKLQMSYKLDVLGAHVHTAKAQQVISELDAAYADLEARLEEERALNDSNAHRLKEIVEMLDAVDTARSWVREDAA